MKRHDLSSMWKWAIPAAAVLLAFLVLFELHFLHVIGTIDRMAATTEDLKTATAPSLRRVSQLTSLRGELRRIHPKLDRVNRQLAAVRGHTRYVTALPQLGRSLHSVDMLPSEVRKLTGLLRVVTAQLLAMSHNVSDMTRAVDVLADDFRGVRRQMDAIRVLLKKTARHVRNLDRKTGPPPPRPGPAR